MKARHEFDNKEQWYAYLRTYFAALAMQGILANSFYPEAVSEGATSTHFAREAVDFADDLVAELYKGSTNA